ncbi:hypothetical protein Asp14428_18210 [Actinoplanes sp. NBRC 14428]|uniref:Peptidase inhibitor family I36 n=1 Tax=Pseudosporangium ferrugineum TaxID=439699 RepID=A0A2T0SBJ2_9ACTN|nr:hypothetical protein [Pseudosporangium ferrugineum]PRY30788.1 hypothetical protein CLV70_104340 [Pseudosporangium ferrugineum]BCJ50346.1 hypothetical protein Asp14428_18210 [Actinoplanes sp. NBRC 14428]
MKTIRNLMAGAAVTAALLAGLPTAAHAQPAAAPARAGAQLLGDGYFYAWDLPYKSGASCRWFNSDTNWGDNCGNFRNRASSVQNNSSQGNYANLYYHPDGGGAWACIAPGDYWDNLANYYFTWGPADGKNKSTNNEIAGFRWTTTQCGR